jgi:hypothetical protein
MRLPSLLSGQRTRDERSPEDESWVDREVAGKPQNRDKIEWKLITDLAVQSRNDAIEKVNWYATRWKIETFHKILKSGCRAEESQLRTAERLVNRYPYFAF